MSFRNINREIVTNKQFDDLDILLRRGKKSVTQLKKLKIRALSEEERKQIAILLKKSGLGVPTKPKK